MPENETLVHDGRTASRWRPIGRRLDEGLPPNDAFPAIQDQFYALFQNVWRQWRASGVDAADLFRAALNDPNALRELIARTHHDRNAQLLRDVAASLQDPDLEGLIGAFLDAAWDSAHTQLQLDCREDTLSPEFTTQVRAMLDRIRQSLLTNPSRFPNRPRREPPPDIGTRLGEDLL